MLLFSVRAENAPIYFSTRWQNRASTSGVCRLPILDVSIRKQIEVLEGWE
jgi:hypothetical protein